MIWLNGIEHLCHFLPQILLLIVDSFLSWNMRACNYLKVTGSSCSILRSLV